MPTECDQCQWNTGRIIPDCGILTCDKGERVWMGLLGLLRIDTVKDDLTVEPCHHRLPGIELKLPRPRTRFQRILQNED